MKFFILAFFAFTVASVQAQDTLFLNEYNGEVYSIQEATKILVREISNEGGSEALERYYLVSGALIGESMVVRTFNYQKEEIWIKNGLETRWYETGELYMQINYKDGKLNGKELTFWEDGKRKRESNYRNGTFVNGKCWDRDGNQVNYFPHETEAEYPGGDNARIIFLSSNMKYPTQARNRGEQGTVFVSFVVDEEGNVVNPEILRGVSTDLDHEALRVVSIMPRWKPATKDGQNVRSRYNMPLRFVLN
jgi:TonB family protein